MKLYIKANNLKILKNLELLLPKQNTKISLYLNNNSYSEYIINLKSANILQQKAKELFYEEKELKKLIKGIYFGNSSCEHLLCSFTDLVEAKNIAKKHHYNFVFVFPPLSQNNLKEAKYILEYLNSDGFCEVVANDIGVLNLALKYKNIKPILGLNFTKVIKPAFIDSILPTDITKKEFLNQKELLSFIEFEIKHTREFYKTLGISRFSLENIECNISFLNDTPKMQVDFYYPFVTVANSKACDIAGIFEDKRGYFAYSECPKYCNFASLEFKHSEVLNIRQRYNTIYKTLLLLDIDKKISKNPKNRLIWEVFL